MGARSPTAAFPPAGLLDEPRTLSAESFAEAEELRSSGASYSVFAKWIEELTPRGQVKVADENLEPEPEQADQAAGPRPSPAGKGRRSLEFPEKGLTKGRGPPPLTKQPVALQSALRAVQPLQGALQPAGQLPAQPA